MNHQNFSVWCTHRNSDCDWGEFLRDIFSEFAVFVIVAPIIEECGKYYIVKRYVYQTDEFDEPVDRDIYAIAAALGFAFLKNIFYVFSIPLTELATLSTVVFLRAILSVPGHALFSSMWGHSLGIVKFGNPRNPSIIVIIGLAGAIMFHALFNYFLLDSLGFAILLVIVFPFLWWLEPLISLDEPLFEFTPEEATSRA
jgi:protease PrsW